MSESNPEFETINDIPDTPCGNAFRKAMKGRQYGYEALTTAWSWFQDGWEGLDPSEVSHVKCEKCGVYSMPK